MATGALRFLATILSRSKNEKHRQAAQWILDAPKELARKIGDIVFGGRGEDGAMSDTAIAELAKLKESANTSTPAKRVDFLDDVVDDLNFVLDATKNAGAKAIALSGFVHSKACVSYWRVPLDGRDLEVDVRDREILVHPVVEVFIGPELSEDALDALNHQIFVDEAKAFESIKAAGYHQVRTLGKSHLVMEEGIAEEAPPSKDVKSESNAEVRRNEQRKSRAKRKRRNLDLPLDTSFESLNTMIESIEQAQMSMQRDSDAYQAARRKRSPVDKPDK